MTTRVAIDDPRAAPARVCPAAARLCVYRAFARAAWCVFPLAPRSVEHPPRCTRDSDACHRLRAAPGLLDGPDGSAPAADAWSPGEPAVQIADGGEGALPLRAIGPARVRERLAPCIFRVALPLAGMPADFECVAKVVRLCEPPEQPGAPAPTLAQLWERWRARATAAPDGAMLLHGALVEVLAWARVHPKAFLGHAYVRCADGALAMVIFLVPFAGTLDALLAHEAATGTARGALVALASLAQIMLVALPDLRARFRMTHGDLKADNVMFLEAAATHMWVRNARAGETRIVPTFGRVFAIIDFGWAEFECAADAPMPPSSSSAPSSSARVRRRRVRSTSPQDAGRSGARPGPRTNEIQLALAARRAVSAAIAGGGAHLAGEAARRGWTAVKNALGRLRGDIPARFAVGEPADWYAAFYTYAREPAWQASAHDPWDVLAPLFPLAPPGPPPADVLLVDYVPPPPP